MYVCLFCWFLLAAWQPRSLVLPQPSVPASRANKTMNFLNCFFVKRVAYFAQNIHFNGCNFLNNSPVYTCTLLLRWLPSCWTYKFSLVRTIVHVYYFPWPRVQLIFVRAQQMFCSCKAVVRAKVFHFIEVILVQHIFATPYSQ